MLQMPEQDTVLAEVAGLGHMALVLLVLQVHKVLFMFYVVFNKKG
jgi:hypothetical protein